MEEEKLMKEQLEKVRENGGDIGGVETIAQMFNDMSTSFNQKYYAKILNTFSKNLRKATKHNKYKEYPMVFASVYAIANSGYYEIEWDDVVDLQPYLPTEIDFEITEDIVREGTIVASRILLNDLNKRIEEMQGDDKGVESLAIRNSIDHCFYSWIAAVASTYQDRGLIDRSLKGFTMLGIEDDQ